MPLLEKLLRCGVYGMCLVACGGGRDASLPLTQEDAQGERAGRRPPPTACEPEEISPVTCGGELCPTSTTHERDPCFLPCCVQHEGRERCGFRGTSRAFTTACVLPAESDPSCDEIPQFEGCCEPTRHVCGVIGGFAPGCQIESPFLTFPNPLKACGAGRDADTDADAGAD